MQEIHFQRWRQIDTCRQEQTGIHKDGPGGSLRNRQSTGRDGLGVKTRTTLMPGCTEQGSLAVDPAMTWGSGEAMHFYKERGRAQTKDRETRTWGQEDMDKHGMRSPTRWSERRQRSRSGRPTTDTPGVWAVTWALVIRRQLQEKSHASTGGPLLTTPDQHHPSIMNEH